MHLLYLSTASGQAISDLANCPASFFHGAGAGAHDVAMDGGEHVHQPAVFPDCEDHVGSLAKEDLALLLQ